MFHFELGRGVTLLGRQHNNGRWCISLAGNGKTREIARSLSEEDAVRAVSLFVGQPAQEGKLKDIARKFKRNLAKSLKQNTWTQPNRPALKQNSGATRAKQATRGSA